MISPLLSRKSLILQTEKIPGGKVSRLAANIPSRTIAGTAFDRVLPCII